MMKKILIIEDDASIRETLWELLESENYQIFQAEHGLKALALLEKKIDPDLILLDLSMPVMDGKTFLKEILARHPEYSCLPILIMTAAGSGEIPKDYDKNMILRKPLDVDGLLSKIEDIILTQVN
jgi:CheY-like chemotaxis protein